MQAAALLETTDLSIEQIADACGYGSHVTSRKAFKATMGMTPRQVRMGGTETL